MWLAVAERGIGIGATGDLIPDYGVPVGLHRDFNENLMGWMTFWP